ncbi:MAG: hypothetical protein IPO21_20830 [Bacteroidales bacterium]|nr:hypothetical protein [Bacteroidales bacterium]
MKKYILLLLFSFIVNYSFSQWSKWKRMRYEVSFGIGTSSFMGDLGGGQNSDSFLDDYFGDFDFGSTRPSFYLGGRYKLSPLFSAKLNLALGWVSGNDEWSNDINRQNRNLNFNSVIFEQSLVGEFNIIKENEQKRWSKIRNKRVRGYSFNLYVFAGIGGFYFNPRGYVVDDYTNKTYYSLYDVGTEGQNITQNHYNRYALCIPGGLGIKFGLNRKWDFGIEYGMRYTFTDYIDDVGGAYYDNKAIIENYKDGNDVNVGYLADNHYATETTKFTETDFAAGSIWEGYDKYYEVGDRKPYPSGTEFRSGKAKDIYMFLFLNFSYKLKTGRNGLPKFR